jgi:hypothetical protein
MSGMSGITLARPLQLTTSRSPTSRTSARPASEALRNARTRWRQRRVRRRDGDRRREGQGQRLPGPRRRPNPDRRHRPHAHRGRDVRDVAPAYARSTASTRRADARGARPHRVEEPLQRRPQPPRAVPQRGLDGDDLQRAAGGRRARRVRLLRRGRRLGRGDRRAGRRRAPLHRQADLHQGAVARRRQRLGQRRPDYDYTTFPEIAATGRDAYAQAGITNPREQLAMAEVHDCFTPTELVIYGGPRSSPSAAPRGRKCSPAPSTSTATCRSTPTAA